MKKIKSICSILLAVLMIVLALPQGLGELKAKAANVISYTYTKYYYSDQNYGYIFTPNIDGKFPVVFNFHGIGGHPNEQKMNFFKGDLEKWVNEGYLSPVVMVMPFIDDSGRYGTVNEDFRIYGRNTFSSLMQNMKSDKLFAKADTSKDYSVAGFSMGGTEALYLGSKFRTKCVNIGCFSAAQQALYYSSSEKKEKGWLLSDNDTKDLGFPTTSSTGSPKLYMAVSNVEKNGEARKYFNHYMEKFGEKYNFETQITDIGEHDVYQWRLAFFSFLRYVQTGEPANEALLTTAARYINQDNNRTVKLIPYKASGTNTSISVKPDFTSLTVNYKDTYQLSVTTTGTISSYEWQYSTDGKSSWTKGAKSTNGPVHTVSSATRDIYYRCVVTNGKETKYSDPIKVSVKPVISSIESSVNGVSTPGKPYTITVTADGMKLSYKWEFSYDNKTWKASTASGYNKETINLIGKENGKTIYYRCKVTAVATTAISPVIKIVPKAN